jgi:hypothetical protein
MYTPTDELMLYSQRAFDVCRDQVYDYEDCRQLDHFGTPNPALCNKESYNLLQCYNKTEETEPICMQAFRRYKECAFQYTNHLVHCEKEMNEFNLCQEKPKWYADNVYSESKRIHPYSACWKRPLV